MRTFSKAFIRIKRMWMEKKGEILEWDCFEPAGNEKVFNLNFSISTFDFMFAFHLSTEQHRISNVCALNKPTFSRSPVPSWYKIKKYHHLFMLTRSALLIYCNSSRRFIVFNISDLSKGWQVANGFVSSLLHRLKKPTNDGNEEPSTHLLFGIKNYLLLHFVM